MCISTFLSFFFNNALHLDAYQIFLKPLLGYPRISMVSPQPIPSAFLRCVLGVTLPWGVSQAKTRFHPSGRLLPQCYSLVCAETFWFHTTLLVNSGYHFLGNWSPLQRALASASLEELPLCFFPLFRVADCTLRSFFYASELNFVQDKFSLLFAGKWIYVRLITLSEITQNRKDEYHVFFIFLMDPSFCK